MARGRAPIRGRMLTLRQPDDSRSQEGENERKYFLKKSKGKARVINSINKKTKTLGEE